MSGALPTFLIVGAHKAATTSLHAYLGSHPDIYMSATKELNFFNGHSSDPLLPSTWHRGVDWYRAQFDPTAPVRGEASTSYSFTPYVPGVPERIASIVPDVRLIYVVRDPIERLLSHYVYVRGEGRERRSLRRLVRARDFAGSRYVVRSLYALQLSVYLRVFDMEQICVVSSEDLANNPKREMDRVFGFLQVRKLPELREWRTRHNSARWYPGLVALGWAFGERATVRLRALPGVNRVGTIWKMRPKRPVVTEEMRRKLVELFASDVAELRSLTGQSFSSWSV